MLGAGRLEGRRRTLAAVAAIVPLTALMLLAGRVADELLLPGGWSELAGGISRGISDLPGVRVPYRGLDDWVRTVIPLGGSRARAARRAAGVLAAPRPARLPGRRRCCVLIVLYVVPVVALDFTVEFLRGAVFTLLMVAFLRLEKLRRPDSAAAAALAVRGDARGAVAAPLLNRDTPWFDYETWAAETSSSKSTSFTGTHNYGGAQLAARRPRAAARAAPGSPPTGRPRTSTTSTASAWLRSQVAARRPRAARTTTRDRQALDAARSRSRSATCARTSSSPPATRPTSTSRG